MKDFKSKNRGFTLIEIMVSVAIFTIIVTAGMGALTMILKTYKFSQAEKKSADSMSYVLESMTREIRLGHNYYLGAGSDTVMDESKNGSLKTSNGNLIGFKASDNRGYIIYSISDGVLFKTQYTNNGLNTPLPLTDKTQVNIESSRVNVMNAEDPDDMKQPLVWIQILATTPGKVDKQRVIQTLVSQRDLDI